MTQISNQSYDKSVLYPPYQSTSVLEYKSQFLNLRSLIISISDSRVSQC